MKVTVDSNNLGEVLACCGIASLAARADPLAESGFVGETFESADVAMTDLVESAKLEIGGIQLDWWEPWGLNPNMKLWAGQQSATSVLKNLTHACSAGQNEPWIDFTVPTTGRLGVDPLGSWNALTIGWSPNEHKAVKMLCRPFVELLAFVGLQHFSVGGNRHEGFTYALWRPVAFPLARIAFAGHGRFASDRHLVHTTKSGSNTILLSGRKVT